MAEFTAQNAIQGPWDAALKSQALRRFALIAAGLLVVTVAARLILGAMGLQDNPLALLLAVALPLVGAIVCLAVAIVIQFNRLIATILYRAAFLVFIGALVGLVVVPWATALLFDYVDGLVAQQDAAAMAVKTSFGGELTVAEIRTFLIESRHPGETNAESTGQGCPVPYFLWLFQFRLLRDFVLGFAVLGFVATTASFAIWWERKVAGRIQSRLGPMRVGGWHGWAQGIADGLKLVQKEDIYLEGADRPMFKIAPYMVFIPVLAAFVALPFSAKWAFRDLDVALLFILAMVGVDVVGVILAGWSSNNKWSIYGAMREACQMVSYEIPMGMSLLIPVMTVGTLKLTEIGATQAGGFHTWLAFANPFTFVAAVVYFISALASCKRAPFDLPEAESELVAGFHTEYSGFRWAVFFFGEYAAMFIISGLAVILFFGAWHSPLPAAWGASLAEGNVWQQALHGLLFSGPIWFIAKAYGFLYVQIWLRWTLPRIRIDQVMYACVQVLLPLTMVLLLGNTFWQILIGVDGIVALVANVLCSLLGAIVMAGFIVIAAYGYLNRRRLVGSLAVKHLPGS